VASTSLQFSGLVYASHWPRPPTLAALMLTTALLATTVEASSAKGLSCIELARADLPLRPGPNTDKHTAQHSTAQHSTTQHSTAQHSTAQHSEKRMVKCLCGLCGLCGLLAYEEHGGATIFSAGLLSDDAGDLALQATHQHSTTEGGGKS